MTANGFRVDAWMPLDADKLAVVQDPNGKQWWIFFPKGTFPLNPESEHRWGPYPTERNAAETLVAFRYQRRIEEVQGELTRALKKRGTTIRALVFLVLVLAASTSAALLQLMPQ